MNDRSTIETSKEIVSEACGWIAQLETGDMSASDLAALREWMARSPAHKREIRTIAELSGQLSVLTELAPALESSAGVGHGVRRSGWRFGWLRPALIATFAVVFLAGIVFSTFVSQSSGAPEIYKTAIGEYKNVELADGSTVSLNTDSQIEVDYTGAERRIRLVNGEALFDVAPNAKRPFVVYSDSAIAKAVGTSFVVRLRNAITELAVVEGAVAFARLPTSPERRGDPVPAESQEDPIDIAAVAGVVVTAGQALTTRDLGSEQVDNAPEQIPSLTERDLQRKLSWTDGFLEFSDTPLVDVVDELTRHNPVSVEIVDTSLSELKFGGIFRTGDVDQLLGALEGLGVDVERVGDDHFLLRAATGE